ncbi:hypothetical protein AOXY_G4011 [Acipenser oxyrinchus oxyrinchus]|uniref:TIR domain-containing protein n=1 Tax=Acipenser oxyrinchus oxyrinchus TaxID=40147 RepID=A0AAD8GFY3_ACIOX|nr:hypothetical protein AOXY_G4011 [Acipenser oxyrinchus oxyrinchus]
MMPGVILEQAYIDRIAEGVKPLQNLASSSADVVYWPIDNEEIQPKIFVSYQWDVQTKVQEIRTFLELNSLWCWADLCIRGHSSMSTRSPAADPTTETLQNKIHRHMKAAAVVLSCFTPKYIHSDNCNKDLQLAKVLHKPLVPVLLHFMPWPPEGTTSSIRRFLCQFATIDLSNDRLFKRNLHLLLNRIKKSLKIKEL